MDSSVSSSFPSSSSPSPSSTSSSSSLVSRARTALHSAATRAEKVLIDIKADLKNDRGRDDKQSHKSIGKDDEDEPPVPSTVAEVTGRASEECRREFMPSRWNPINLGKKQDWQNSLKMLGKAKKDGKEEQLEKTPLDYFVSADSLKQKKNDVLVVKEMDTIGKKDSSNLQKRSSVLPALILKNLAAAMEKGKVLVSMKDLKTLDISAPLMKEKTGVRFSVVKSIMLREKEDNLNSSVCSNSEIRSIVQLLFDAEDLSTERESRSTSGTLPAMYIRGAPPESFLVKVSEITGGFKSLNEMVSFWHYIVIELRRLWSECKPIPYMPVDENPDLDCCQLHQQLQVINCCIARKLRRTIAMESLYSMESINPCNYPVALLNLSVDPMPYARTITGDHILRLGANRPAKDLIMLETGEPIYSPITQEGPVFTEELIKETEEFVLRTGSIGAGCSQLLSDMQSFKAANPGCILEDFVRWYSPPDWKEESLDGEENGPQKRGCLSGRMQKEGNLWRELWEAAKPLPAAKQAPLFDEELAVERIFASMEDMPPYELLEQQFLSLLYSGFAVAENVLSLDTKFSKLFCECKEYVTATCQGGLSGDNIGELCKVYETIETVLVHPEEITWVSEEKISDEPKGKLKKLGLPFLGKNRLFLPKRVTKDQKRTDEKNVRTFSNLFDGKTSLFTRKQLHLNPAAGSQTNIDGNDSSLV